MYVVGYGALLMSLLLSLLYSGLAVWLLWRKQPEGIVWFERIQKGVAGLFTLASLILVVALWSNDFSYNYVASYTDLDLSKFYALTAFWAGQDGSFLFWAWMTSLAGVIFACTAGYKKLQTGTKLWYWLFFLLIQAFFLLLLTGPNNPFIILDPAPKDGLGLNPLLQNPGMIFHPPLLFLGYVFFTSPACLALASWMHGEQRSWIHAGRNFLILAWIFLTAGIILGCWWSYMELGWGGYWAWDPVENASLLPWLSASALLHLLALQRRCGTFPKANVFLAVFTYILCIFSTYLVRSGIVQSVHAFGQGGVALPLLIFIMIFLLLIPLVIFGGKGDAKPQPLGPLISRQGLLTFTA